jgi:hypothetical protein
VVVNPSTGLLSGTPTAHGRTEATVTVADASASTSVSFVWTIKR